jgi:hypothetical protein
VFLNNAKPTTNSTELPIKACVHSRISNTSVWQVGAHFNRNSPSSMGRDVPIAIPGFTPLKKENPGDKPGGLRMSWSVFGLACQELTPLYCLPPEERLPPASSGSFKPQFYNLTGSKHQKEDLRPPLQNIPLPCYTSAHLHVPLPFTLDMR